MDSCVLVVTMCTKRFEWHFGKVLLTVREFCNFVDVYTGAVKRDSSDCVTLGFENSFGSAPAHIIAKYSKYKHCMKNLMRSSKSHKTN